MRKSLDAWRKREKNDVGEKKKRKRRRVGGEGARGEGKICRVILGERVEHGVRGGTKRKGRWNAKVEDVRSER